MAKGKLAGTIKGKKVFGAKVTNGLRTRKMIRPICEEHFPADASINKYSGWWEFCKTHHEEGDPRPYSHYEEIVIRRPKLEERDGRTFRTGWEEEVEMTVEPNWTEVPDEISVYSSKGVAASLERGFIFPEELGYAPFCDMKGCSVQNPKFRTEYGTYHTREEAAIMLLRGEETAIFVSTDRESNKERQKQLREAGAGFVEAK